MHQACQGLRPVCSPYSSATPVELIGEQKLDNAILKEVGSGNF